MDLKNKLNEISKILKEFSLQDSNTSEENIPLLMRIKEKLEAKEELVFILPAFPAKSPSREKTFGELPDFGEVLALKNLQSFCNRIDLLHPNGTKVVICSDGRVFSDVVKVSDESIDRYNDGIITIIEEYNLRSLSVFTMDELYPDKTPEDLREILLEFYAMALSEVRELVIENLNYRSLFNGIHRFLFEDEFSMNKKDSKNQIQKKTKIDAYELMRRSDAWSSLLNEHFRDALRLSIHPHPLGHEKFGIKLVPSASQWATPWHNVVVKIKDQFELMHKSEALKLNAVLKMENQKYAYFEIPNIQ